MTGGKLDLPYQYEVLIPKRGVRQMQPMIISIDRKKAKFELRQHPGEQFIMMMEGEMSYVCGNREFPMKPGDCLYFGARITHGPKAKRNQKARYLVVHTTEPPTRSRRSSVLETLQGNDERK
jgi:mannose-6-phosphate isomerase-like protein (cupin superfamily)